MKFSPSVVTSSKKTVPKSNHQLIFIKVHYPYPLCTIMYISTRGTSILGEVCNVEISRATQQLSCSKSHDFLAIHPQLMQFD